MTSWSDSSRRYAHNAAKSSAGPVGWTWGRPSSRTVTRAIPRASVWSRSWCGSAALRRALSVIWGGTSTTAGSRRRPVAEPTPARMIPNPRSRPGPQTPTHPTRPTSPHDPPPCSGTTQTPTARPASSTTAHTRLSLCESTPHNHHGLTSVSLADTSQVERPVCATVRRESHPPHQGTGNQIKLLSSDKRAAGPAGRQSPAKATKPVSGKPETDTARGVEPSPPGLPPPHTNTHGGGPGAGAPEGRCGSAGFSRSRTRGRGRHI